MKNRYCLIAGNSYLRTWGWSEMSNLPHTPPTVFNSLMDAHCAVDGHKERFAEYGYGPSPEYVRVIPFSELVATA